MVARGISTHGWETVSWRVTALASGAHLPARACCRRPRRCLPRPHPHPMYVHCVAVYNGSFPTPALPKYPEATFQELGWEHGCASCAASASFDQCMRGCDSWPNYGCCSSSCASLCQRDVSLQQAAKEICEAACVSCYAPPPPPGTPRPQPPVPHPSRRRCHPRRIVWTTPSNSDPRCPLLGLQGRGVASTVAGDRPHHHPAANQPARAIVPRKLCRRQPECHPPPRHRRRRPRCPLHLH